jgi:hypothetical protein
MNDAQGKIRDNGDEGVFMAAIDALAQRNSELFKFCQSQPEMKAKSWKPMTSAKTSKKYNTIYERMKSAKQFATGQDLKSVLVQLKSFDEKYTISIMAGRPPLLTGKDLLDATLKGLFGSLISFGGTQGLEQVAGGEAAV